MAVGILGGVFDPPHNGHVALARAALRELSLGRLEVRVVADPGHKRTATPAETRLELTRLAFEDVPEAVVELDPHARTVDSLEERRPDDGVFVLGADELARLYRGAAVVAYPSRFEGFGIPVIEAMACGVPVVASSHESLDEASGDAALRADPDEPGAWAEALQRAVAEREQLVPLGLAHSGSFSWRGVGEVFLRGYERALP